MSEQITTVCKLREYLETVPDETEIYAQVSDTAGTAWNLNAFIGAGSIKRVFSILPRAATTREKDDTGTFMTWLWRHRTAHGTTYYTRHPVTGEAP